MSNLEEKIYNNIAGERERQKSLYSDDFDDNNTINDWVAYINIYLGRCVGPLHSNPSSKSLFIDCMMKIATLAIAAIEAAERNDGVAPRHYDKGKVI